MTMPREYHREYSKKYYHRKREELIKLLGGKCKKCSSTENLHFDHIDPTNRGFKIGKLLNYSKEKLMEEVQKCQLLCRKCHDKKSNNEGSYRKGRRIGSAVFSSKLVEDQVKDIRIKLKNGSSITIIAKEYNMSYDSIKLIKSGKTWKHVTID